MTRYSLLGGGFFLFFCLIKTMEWPVAHRSWIRGAKEDGILYIPYSRSEEESDQPIDKPIIWFFVLDASASMLESIIFRDKTKMTRWTVSIQLFKHVFADLKRIGRPEDRVSVVTFNNTVKILFNDQLLKDVDEQKIFIDISPGGSTDIGQVNAVVHTLMFCNSHLRANTHRAAEIFFTDGEATQGILDRAQLQTHKATLYKNLQTEMGMIPFLWCGAISQSADWGMVRKLSLASPFSLWAYIKESEMEMFGSEVGGVVSTAIHMKPVQVLPDQPPLLLLPDIPNLFYFPTRPTKEEKDLATCPSLVTLFRIRHAIYSVSHQLSSSEIEEFIATVKKCQKFDDAFINLSVQRTSFFETMKANLLLDLEEMEQKGHLHLTRQLSQVRNGFNLSPLVRSMSHEYAQIVLSPEKLKQL